MFPKIDGVVPTRKTQKLSRTNDFRNNRPPKRDVQQSFFAKTISHNRNCNEIKIQANNRMVEMGNVKKAWITNEENSIEPQLFSKNHQPQLPSSQRRISQIDKRELFSKTLPHSPSKLNPLARPLKRPLTSFSFKKKMTKTQPLSQNLTMTRPKSTPALSPVKVNEPISPVAEEPFFDTFRLDNSIHLPESKGNILEGVTPKRVVDHYIHATEKEFKNVLVTIDKTQEMLPLTFLFEHKTEEYDFAGKSMKATMDKFFSRLISGFKWDALQKWKSVVKYEQHLERSAASLKIQCWFRMLRAFREARRRRFNRERTNMKRNDKETHHFRNCWWKATKIQSIWRMYVERIMFLEILQEHQADTIAARSIQVWYRAVMARNSFIVKLLEAHIQRKASIQMQRVVRGHLGRKRAKLFYQEKQMLRKQELWRQPGYLLSLTFQEQGAALVITRWAKRCLAWNHLRFVGHEKAIMIQKIIRGFLGRKEAVRVRHQRRHYLSFLVYQRRAMENASNRIIWQESAVSIQKIFRGYNTRLKTAPMLLDAKIHRMKRLALKKSVMREHAEKVNLDKLKNVIKRQREKPSAKQMHLAARRIQVWYRKRFWLKLAKKVKKRAQRQKATIKRYLRLNGAIEMQRIWRGYVARKNYKRTRYYGTVIKLEAWWRNEQIRMGLLKRALELKCAVKLCDWWKRALCRLNIWRWRKFKIMAICGQRLWRGFAQRKKFKLMIANVRQKNELEEKGRLEVALCWEHLLDRLIISSCGGFQDNTTEDGEPDTHVFGLKHVGAAMSRGFTRQVARQFGTRGKARITGPVLAKIFKDTPKLESKKLRSTKVDLIFQRIVGKRKDLTVEEFGRAIREIADLRFQSVTQVRRCTNSDARVVSLVRRLFFAAPWCAEIRVDVQEHAHVLQRKAAILCQRFWRRVEFNRFYLVCREAAALQRLNRKKGKAAIVIQTQARKFMAKLHLRTMLFKYIKKFHDMTTDETYWFNTINGERLYTKPLLFGKEDVPIVPLPVESRQLRHLCQHCNQQAHLFCLQCQFVYCRSCCKTQHEWENATDHKFFEIKMCDFCQFQSASRFCDFCEDNYCCNCFLHCHSDGLKDNHSYVPLLHFCDECDKDFPWASKWYCKTDEKETCGNCQRRHYFEDSGYPHDGYDIVYKSVEVDLYLEKLEQERLKQLALDREETERLRRLAQQQFKAATGLQRVFRGHRVRKRYGSSMEQWKQRKADDIVRRSAKYRSLLLVGRAPPLLSDTDEDRARNVALWRRFTLYKTVRAEDGTIVKVRKSFAVHKWLYRKTKRGASIAGHGISAGMKYTGKRLGMMNIKDKGAVAIARGTRKIGGILADKAGTRALEGGKTWGKMALYFNKKVEKANKRLQANKKKKWKQAQAKIKHQKRMLVTPIGVPATVLHGIFRKIAIELRAYDKERMFMVPTQEKAYSAFMTAEKMTPMDLETFGAQVPHLKNFMSLKDMLMSIFENCKRYFAPKSKHHKHAKSVQSVAELLVREYVTAEGVLREHMNLLLKAKGATIRKLKKDGISPYTKKEIQEFKDAKNKNIPKKKDDERNTKTEKKKLQKDAENVSRRAILESAHGDGSKPPPALVVVDDKYKTQDSKEETSSEAKLDDGNNALPETESAEKASSRSSNSRPTTALSVSSVGTQKRPKSALRRVKFSDDAEKKKSTLLKLEEAEAIEESKEQDSSPPEVLVITHPETEPLTSISDSVNNDNNNNDDDENVNNSDTITAADRRSSAASVVSSSPAVATTKTTDTNIRKSSIIDTNTNKDNDENAAATTTIAIVKGENDQLESKEDKGTTTNDNNSDDGVDPYATTVITLGGIKGAEDDKLAAEVLGGFSNDTLEQTANFMENGENNNEEQYVQSTDDTTWSEWQEYFDEGGNKYYYNSTTGESMWETEWLSQQQQQQQQPQDYNTYNQQDQTQWQQEGQEYYEGYDANGNYSY
eukprot:TRINITY_DN139_c6_g1_i1.p1 TRINITY_DN139_c6_g1~~TRINITY_DN139_c6_g1_i1.p1  ORF type:complete len:1951 (-),score=511.50 TRINITY_DN139_c6_g1_i1:133-5985(-)